MARIPNDTTTNANKVPTLTKSTRASNGTNPLNRAITTVAIVNARLGFPCLFNLPTPPRVTGHLDQQHKLTVMPHTSLYTSSLPFQSMRQL